MTTIYLDSNFCCHTENDGTMMVAETNAVDGKCKTFIEGYRFIPQDYEWQAQDETVYHGQMITPFVDYNTLLKAQEQYEADLVLME